MQVTHSALESLEQVIMAAMGCSVPRRLSGQVGDLALNGDGAVYDVRHHQRLGRLAEQVSRCVVDDLRQVWPRVHAMADAYSRVGYDLVHSLDHIGVFGVESR